MEERLRFTTATTERIEAIVGKEEMEIAAFHEGRYNPEDFVVISIQNPTDTTDLQPMLSKFKKSLHIRFSDVTEATQYKNETYLPINVEQTDQILDFILENKEEKFFIHCEAGVSRSAGVGIALECILEHDGDTEKFDPNNNVISNHWRYTPNTFVIDTLIKQFLTYKQV